jgi:hypothetical protein
MLWAQELPNRLFSAVHAYSGFCVLLLKRKCLSSSRSASHHLWSIVAEHAFGSVAGIKQGMQGRNKKGRALQEHSLLSGKKAERTKSSSSE